MALKHWRDDIRINGETLNYIRYSIVSAINVYELVEKAKNMNWNQPPEKKLLSCRNPDIVTNIDLNLQFGQVNKFKFKLKNNIPEDDTVLIY